jgi:hypothetical protein
MTPSPQQTATFPDRAVGGRAYHRAGPWPKPSADKHLLLSSADVLKLSLKIDKKDGKISKQRFPEMC